MSVITHLKGKITMKLRLYVSAALALLLYMGMASSARAQMRIKMSPAEVMAALKVGQWVKMEGIVQRDFTVMTKSVEILTGDFLESDWSITAVARDVDHAQKELKLLRLPIKTVTDTEFENQSGSLPGGFADLKEGMLMEVDGTYLKDGSFQAIEIEDLTQELVEDQSLRNEVEAVGKVEKIDTTRRTATVMGITFLVVNDTELKSAVK
jgi:hypothetical protein